MTDLFAFSTPVTPGAELTMSSREIADLTGKRHKHILRDVEKMFCGIGLEGGPNLVRPPETYKHSYLNVQGQRQPEYRLPKDLTLTLVSGYRADLRLRIVRRWLSLEGGSARVPEGVMRELAAIREDLAWLRDRLAPGGDSGSPVTPGKQAYMSGSPGAPGKQVYMTVARFVRRHGLPVSHGFAVWFGRQTSAFCRERGIRIKLSKNANKYPVFALEAAMPDFRHADPIGARIGTSSGCHERPPPGNTPRVC